MLLHTVVAIHQVVPHGPAGIEIGPVIWGQRRTCVGCQLGEDRREVSLVASVLLPSSDDGDPFLNRKHRA